MIKRIVLALSLLMLLAIVSVVGLGFYGYSWLHGDVVFGNGPLVYQVKRGATINSVAGDLSSLKVIRYPKIWALYARFFQPAPIRAGEYQLNDTISPQNILTLLQEGKVISYHVTLVEGSTVKEFEQVLGAQKKLTHVLPSMSDAEKLRALEVEGRSMEGWVFPDTYHYVLGDTDLNILKRAHKKMKSELQGIWHNKKTDVLSSPYELLILASIIEKETGAVWEQPEISGVFTRRLKKGMRLQTDPTVIYGLGASYDGNLKRKHLRQATPYNTYVIKGLPPTPIANPGITALKAAANPNKGEALYFVAKGDGTHQFSNTLAEHNTAVNLYQKRRNSNYRSTLKSTK